MAYDDYIAALNDWTVQTIVRDETCIGAFYCKNGEVHVSILPEWRKKWATRGLLREILSRKNVHTRITPGHDYMHGILNRLGFESDASGKFVMR